MAEDTPRPERPAKDRGFHARNGNDPTLASYLSSLLYLLGVPTLVLLAYGGHWAGLYGYGAIIPAFGALLVALIVLAFAATHVLTGGR
jgi:hypothetical protein